MKEIFFLSIGFEKFGRHEGLPSSKLSKYHIYSVEQTNRFDLVGNGYENQLFLTNFLKFPNIVKLRHYFCGNEMQIRGYKSECILEVLVSRFIVLLQPKPPCYKKVLNYLKPKIYKVYIYKPLLQISYRKVSQYLSRNKYSFTRKSFDILVRF